MISGSLSGTSGHQSPIDTKKKHGQGKTKRRLVYLLYTSVSSTPNPSCCSVFCALLMNSKCLFWWIPGVFSAIHLVGLPRGHNSKLASDGYLLHFCICFLTCSHSRTSMVSCDAGFCSTVLGSTWFTGGQHEVAMVVVIELVGLTCYLADFLHFHRWTPNLPRL